MKADINARPTQTTPERPSSVRSDDLFNFRMAEFSACRTYRYALWRVWDQAKPVCVFVGLNPSTADETTDDPTIRRCVGFASDWGFGGLAMANLFAVRATDPREMIRHPAPIGPDNDRWLVQLNRQAGRVVAAWGTRGIHLARDRAVRRLLGDMTCLKLTKDGHPQHPLYVARSTAPRPF